MCISIKKASNEHDFLDVLEIESRICSACGLKYSPYHIGGLVFDRFLFGNGSPDFFDYGYMVLLDNILIGYALCFVDEHEYYIGILPEYRSYYSEAIKLTNGLYKGGEINIIANTNDIDLIGALKGYVLVGEERFQAGLLLKDYNTREVEWKNETISLLESKDLENRARFGYIPTDEVLTTNLYSGLMDSPYYSKALDYVIYDNESGEFAGFVTWWLDEKSNTALLEPVACIKKFRQRGIMKRALLYGLNELKGRGVSAVYVSTSINNNASQHLYSSVGFIKIGTANLYKKKEI